MDKKLLFLKTWTRILYYNNRTIIFIRRNKFTKQYDKFFLILILPYIIINSLLSFLFEPLFSLRIKSIREKEKKRKFNYEIGIVSISKNEGPYIKEWIEYHKLVGINKFYFYDNESEDNTKDIIEPYIQNGTVTYKLVKGKAQQIPVYNDAIHRYKNECRYLAFIDMDEYIVPSEPFKKINVIISDIINKYGKGASGIGLNWAIYGSSGHVTTPDGLITENFTKRGINNHYGNAHIKTICNPRMISYYISPHYAIYKRGAYSIDETGSKKLYVWFNEKPQYKNMRINHYFTKSKEQYIQKKSRGLGDRLGEYDMNMFYQYDLNDVDDFIMKPYIKALKNAKI